MDLYVNGHNIFIIVLVTFLFTLLLVPVVRKMAIHVGSFDKPNKRRVNKSPMPTMGGLAIFFSFMLGYMLYAQTMTLMLPILMGSILIVIIGIIDGINPVKAKYKLIVELIAACIIVFYGNIYIDEVTIFGLNFELPMIVGTAFSIVFIVAITNAINLIDGLDGLASGISAIYFLTISIIAFILNQAGGLDITLALIMLGATLGFLAHNFPPAKIYLGDTGSLFLGFIIAIISLLGLKTVTITSLVIPILILAIPILDTLFAIFRRLLKREKLSTPDKEHLHHQLFKISGSQTKAVLLIYLIDILFASVSVFYVLGESKYAAIIYLLLIMIFLLLITKTNILFRNKKK